MADNDVAKLKWSFDRLTNVGHVVSETAARMGDGIAVAAPRRSRSRRPIQYQTMTFSQLETNSSAIALGLQNMGVQPGTRLALMVPPGLDFVAFVFGLFKAGVVVILIDPGMGRKNMIRCLADVQPSGMVGIPIAQLMRNVFARRFPECRYNVVVSSKWWPGCVSAARFERIDGGQFQAIDQSSDAPAAIIFTTGSTGPPKGVLYRHRVFLEQARQIRDHFKIEPGSVDVSGFPLFALFNCAMGTTTVFPQMDATRPAHVDPLDIKDAIDTFHADQSFGSPALWNRVSMYAVEHNISFPTIRRVFTAGAPVPPHVLDRVKKIIHADGQVYTPYGATEALPVASNSASVVLNETAAKTQLGLGTCVGQRFPDIRWRIIAITDDPISEISESRELLLHQIGELIVRGAVVTDQYVSSDLANSLHKIRDGDGFWHRMGDVGYLDEQDRFWFCGRKSQRVITRQGTMYTIVVEGIVNTHPKIYRSALVGVGTRGDQTPAVICEPWPKNWPGSKDAKRQLIDEVLEICQSNPLTCSIGQILLKRRLPVDIRHNSKIFREQLATWATGRIS